MDLSVRETSSLLNISENKIYRWIQNGSIPAHKLHEQYYLNRVYLLEWAAAHHYSVSNPSFNINPLQQKAPLSMALKKGGIFYNLSGVSKKEIFQAAAHLPGIPSCINRKLLNQILQRDSMTPLLSFTKEGIFIPHPRYPFVFSIPDPVLLLCSLKSPVIFTLNCPPAQAFFLLFSPSVLFHIQITTLLTVFLSDAVLKDLILLSAPGEAILDRIKTLEAQI